MKITVEFDTWEEMQGFCAKQAKAEPEKAEPEKAEPEKAEPEKAEPEKAEPEKAEPEKVEPEKAEPEKVEPEKAEPETAESSYSLQDMQKAVREAVKKADKETVLEILGHYSSKTGDGQAKSASTVKPEDYAAAIAELRGVAD